MDAQRGMALAAPNVALRRVGRWRAGRAPCLAGAALPGCLPVFFPAGFQAGIAVTSRHKQGCGK